MKTNSDSIIEIRGLTKKYGKLTAVNQISLSVKKGEIFGFVGKNGAGKSTTIRCMLNMIFPTAGSIEIAGLDSVKDTKAIKQSLSYMPSDISFYDGIRSKELFKLCLELAPGSDMQRVEELCTFFELDGSKKVSELSLGNKKKVCIIQALLKNAQILVLDEPTNGLDPYMQNKFFELILKEKEKGTTVFLSSHNLSEVEKYCDHVAIIKDGKIVDVLDMENTKIKHAQQVSFTRLDGSRESFELNCDINELIARLSKEKLEHLEIKNKSVEDEFIQYYKGDEA